MKKNVKNSRSDKPSDQKQTRKRRSDTPQKDRPNETPWRHEQKSDAPEYDDEPGRMQQIEDSVKNGEYLPHGKYKNMAGGE